MSSSQGPDAPRLEERLRTARGRAFVGRSGELAAFRSALAGEPGAPAMLYVYGPGGIGKSALLRRFADEARAAARPVVEVEGRSGLSPAAFEEEAAEVVELDTPLLLVDGFEHCQGLEGWLRQRFLPRLSSRALVVVAGRSPLSPAWRNDPGWTSLIRHLRLAALSHREATALLDTHNVPAAPRERVLSYAKGNPLALCLAGDVAARDGRWNPSYEVATVLLGAFVDEVPSPSHRRALEVCAHARTTTQDLLRAALPSAGESDAEELFTWLRDLPFVESGRRGLHPHDVVREALDAELRWRDRQGYEDMHRRIARISSNVP